MWSTRNRSQKSEVRRQPRGAWRRLRAAVVSRRFAYCLLLSAFCLLSAGCRMDMQDQPKYKTFRAGDEKFGVSGASVRPLVEGTVPRQTGGPYRDREDYFYTGKTASLPGGGAQSGAQTGGMGAAAPNTTAGAPSSPLAGASVTGNAAGGVPGAREAAATGGPDLFPFAIDEAALRRGRERYNIYCIVCHGATGEGDGMVVRRGFRKPPSYYEDRLQEGTTPAAHFFDVITNGWGAMPSYAEQIPAEDRWKIIAYIRALQLSRKLKMNDLSPEDQQKVLRGAQRPAGGEPGGSELQSTQPGGQPANVEGNQ
jgi:mono/diheme cytochrome c family protein